MLSLLASALILAAPHASKAASGPEVVKPFDQYIGMYLNGGKSGWMHVFGKPKAGGQFLVTAETHMAVRSMGRISETMSVSERTYDIKSGQLIALKNSQGDAGQAGVFSIVGKRHGKVMELKTTKFGASTVARASVDERLNMMKVDERLARRAVVGATETIVNFDAGSQRNLHVIYTVVGVENHDNVENAVHLTYTVAEARATADEWLDASGHMLSTVQGPLTMRVEPRETAMHVDIKGDLMMDLLVRAPQAIPHLQTVNELKLDFEGMGTSFLPPSSPRQQVSRSGDMVEVILHRDEMPTKSLVGQPNPTPTDAQDVKNALQPTAEIESDNADIAATAKQVVGGEQDAFKVNDKLVMFVYRSLRKQYVAGFGDALFILKSGRGDCTEHSTLFVALARASGLPARIVTGIAYLAPLKGFGWHAWAEVYMGGRWIAVDPTFGQMLADIGHVKMGMSPEDNSATQVMGKISIVQMAAH